MLFLDGGLGLVWVALWIFCLIDVITTPDTQCRNLPKLAWVFIVLLFMDIGSIAWLLAGRQWNKAGVAAGRSPRAAGGSWGSPSAPTRKVATNPDDDEEFLASLRQRAEEQRRRARETQKPDAEPTDGDPA